MGTGIGMISSVVVGKYTMYANKTAEIAPDAPKDAYSGLFLCLYQEQEWLITRPAKYKITNRVVPM